MSKGGEAQSGDGPSGRKRHGKWTLRIDNYSGVLREVLTRELVEIGEDKVSWIEVFFEQKNKLRDPFQTFHSIPYELANEYSIFLRINMFNNA
jgi:hypothetical protein